MTSEHKSLFFRHPVYEKKNIDLNQAAKLFVCRDSGKNFRSELTHIQPVDSPPKIRRYRHLMTQKQRISSLLVGWTNDLFSLQNKKSILLITVGTLS